MIAPLRLVALTPVETLLDIAEVSWIQVPLADGGGLGIYPGHAPLLAETAPGDVRYATATGELGMTLDAGILHISEGVVTLYTSGALSAESDAQGEGASDMRFDRLARVLRQTLGAQPDEPLRDGDEVR